MAVNYLEAEHTGVALIDAASGNQVSYAELRDITSKAKGLLPGPRDLVFVLADSTLESTLRYLTAMASDHAVVLLDAGMDPGFLVRLVETYSPGWILGRLPSDFVGNYPEAASGTHVRGDAIERGVHPDLKLLLPTSGSTGSPKMVRLAESSVSANTRSVALSLHLDASSRAITSLPMHYSYGLSVLQSHLFAGGAVVVTDHTVLEREFWESVDKYGVTSLAGVPYTFQMLKRLRFDPSIHPSLRAMTQAGGGMDRNLTEYFHGLLAPAGVGLYVMYGQTEAAPRITCLPPRFLPDKLGSAGLPMNGGEVYIDRPGYMGAREHPGEVIYVGPNVMMGYATGPDDLALGDVQGSALATGDLGFVDEDGFLFITGRLKRIAKVYGVRISLDEVERLAADLGPVAAVAGEDRIHIFHCAQDEHARAVKSILGKEIGVTPTSIRMHHLEELPTLSTCKYDYGTLATLAVGP